MRERPTLRIPLGILALLAMLGLYALAGVWASRWIERLPIALELLVYLILGVAWLLPLKRFLMWMETGRWR